MPKSSCSAKRREANLSLTTQYPSKSDTTSPKISPLQNVTFFGKDFMDSLLNFMQHSHSFLQNWRQEKQYMMTNEERQIRLQELMALIAVKEKELVELEAQRAQLSAIPNESYANYTSGVERYNTSERKEHPQQPYQYPVNEYQEESYVIENADTQYPSSDDYSSYTSQQYAQIPNLGCRPRTPTYESDEYEGSEIVDDRYYEQTTLQNPN